MIMNSHKKKIILACTALLLAASAITAKAQIYSNTVTGGIVPNYWAVPGGGLQLLSTFSVPELAGPLVSFQVSLNNVNISDWSSYILVIGAPNAVGGSPSYFSVFDSDSGAFGNGVGTFTFNDNPANPSFPTSLVSSGGSFQAATVDAYENGGISSFTNFFNSPTGYEAGTWQVRVQDFGGTGTDTVGSVSLELSAVPEPSSYVLFGLGALGLMVAFRRKQTA